MKNPQSPSGQIDLALVRTLKALFDTGQVSRAAERLGVSQPAVSQQLKRIREHFDDPMFVRIRNRLHPTPRAVALEDTIARLVRDIELVSVQPARFDPQDASRSFVISFSEAAEVMVLPALFAQLRREAPGCSVRSVPQSLRTLREEMERGEVDLLAGTLLGADEGLRQQRLGEYGLVCLTARHGRWAHKAPTTAEYAESPHVVVPRPSGSKDPIERKLEELGIRRIAALSVTSHFAAVAAAEREDLICTVPEQVGHYAARMYSLRVHPLPVELGTIVTRMVWHERSHHDGANRWLRKLVERAYRSAMTAQSAPGAGPGTRTD